MLGKDPVVRFRLVSLDEVNFRTGELMRVARHPAMLVFYLVFALLLVVINANGTVRDLPLEWRAPVYLLGAALGIGFVIGCLRLAEWRARGLGRLVTVHGTPVFFGAALVAVFAGEALSMAATETQPMGFVQGLLLVIFYHLLAELSVAFIAGYIVPRALGEIRGERPAPRRARRKPRLPAPVAVPKAVPQQIAPADPVPTANAGNVTRLPLRAGSIQAGNRRYLVAEVERVEAEGNYVRIVTARSRELQPGPFSQVVAQMPPMAGQVVSRSCWVATDAVLSHRRRGRDLYLLMRDGTELRVATTRRDAVMAWLRQVELRQAPAG